MQAQARKEIKWFAGLLSLALTMLLSVGPALAGGGDPPPPSGSCDPGSETINQKSFHQDLAYRWAPFVIQDTASKWYADTIGRFDFDGDWTGNNNWENLSGSGTAPWNYYNVVETSTHWFIFYHTFHARDWNNVFFGTCGPDPDCHENDSENLLIMVQKDGSTYGRFRLMETRAHTDFYEYAFANDGVHDGTGPDADDLDNDAERGFALFTDSSIGINDPRPAVYIESKGHGMCDWWDNNGPYCVHPDDRVGTSGNDGIMYYPDASATPTPPPSPKGGQWWDHKRPYKLISLWDDFWVLRSCLGNGKTLDNGFTYPGVAGNGVPEVGGSMDGDTHGDDGGAMYWAQKDDNNNLAKGDWGFDPAVTVERQLDIDDVISTSYTYNPYLGIQ